ncbi:hypothetical protein KEM48_002609 [Puccinia striiformis f. sp. tritici PST-130]|nr:hypothetical protein KEM48_002609 [Puccinia striiformis f. sp. tritici PST-130]
MESTWAPSKGSSPPVNLAKHKKQKGTEGILIVVTSNNKAVFTLDLLEIKQKSVNGHINGVTGQDWIRINYVIDDHPMTYKRDNGKEYNSSNILHVSNNITIINSNQNTSRYRNSLDSSSTSSEPESPAADPLIPDDQIALHQISADNPRTKRKNTTIKTPTSISANLPAPNDGDVDWDGPEEVILISALIKDAWAQPPGAPHQKGLGFRYPNPSTFRVASIQHHINVSAITAECEPLSKKLDT